jgi:inosine/xanthosine triphosphate pyrophosphatase family protein
MLSNPSRAIPEPFAAAIPAAETGGRPAPQVAVAQPLSLVTSNPAKYAPLADLLAQLGVAVCVPGFELPEWQDDDFLAVLHRKARLAREALGSPCLVDDSGLLLDAYPGFPGPLTGNICRLLGAHGLERLLASTTARARLVCHVGCWLQGELWHWQGEVAGRVDPRRPVGQGPGPLAQWFVPDEAGEAAGYLHRRRALEALGRDIARLRQALDAACSAGCVFCQEFAGHASSIYRQLLGRELPSRVVHATPHFLVFPPLGQFIEGGLLLVTREHHLAMAYLPESYYDDLERLMRETSDLLWQRYGCRPLFFEHAPVAPGDKGTCCVDHAHLNVFPVDVDVHRHLEQLPHVRIGRMCELAHARPSNQAYLFLQTQQGARFVYDAPLVPSQYIRKIVTAGIGRPDRWHWREYLGLEELQRTFAALSGWNRHDAAARPRDDAVRVT